MKPTPHEARERLLTTLARTFCTHLRDHGSNGAMDLRAEVMDALDAVAPTGTREPHAMVGRTHISNELEANLVGSLMALREYEPNGGEDARFVIDRLERGGFSIVDTPATLETYTPDAHAPHEDDCSTILRDGGCDCGADIENAERKALASAVVSAMTAGMVKRERCFERFMMTLHQQGFEVVRRGEMGGAALNDAVHRAEDALKQIAETVGGKADVPLVSRVARLVSAVRWALGEEGEFKAPEVDMGGGRDLKVAPFWWRRDLRRRAFGEG